jgi:hypothetical protein
MNWRFWKPACRHTFGMWATSNVLRNDQGGIKLVQVRLCGKCGFMELNVQEK